MNESATELLLHDSPNQRLALQTAKKLTDAGFVAYFAGGCVRDSLLGRVPKDYDVATNATPDQVRALFGKHRTLPIGAAFGVICVLGNKPAIDGQIEVATFRNDGCYIDGRRPQGVTFSTPSEDAQRRDFTINGLFFDPLSNQIIDFVGGREDLRQKVVRAIGVPHERFQEDKLRLLRGVRFAAEFDFAIENETFQAIRSMADQITAVSGERIAAEMQRCLKGSHPGSAIELLQSTGLLSAILPESLAYWNQPFRDSGKTWGELLPRLASDIGTKDFSAGISALLYPALALHQGTDAASKYRHAKALLDGVAARWKLSNEVRDKAMTALCHSETLVRAKSLPWSQVQPTLVHPYRDTVLAFAQSLASNLHRHQDDGISFCQTCLTWTTERLDPQPLLDGNALQEAGFKPSPRFREILMQVRNLQLDGQLHNRAEAIDFAKRLMQSE